MEAANNLNISEILHVDSVDPSNEAFIEAENINYTPTTFIVKNGVVVQTVVGFKTTAEIEQILDDSLNN